MMKFVNLAAIMAVAGFLGACANGQMGILESSAVASQEAASPVRRITVKATEESLLACIRQSGALRGVRIGVEGIKDDTGKANYAAQGSTGSFLPGPSAGAAEIIEALIKMGAAVNDYHSTSGTRELAGLGGPVVGGMINTTVRNSLPTYMVGGSYTSLDFTGGISADVQIAGIGPVVNTRGALVGMNVALRESGSNGVVSIKSGTRSVPFVEVGVSGGKSFGDKLVTGTVTGSVQGALQYSAIYGPLKVLAAYNVIHARDPVKGHLLFPKANAACGKQLDEVFQSYPTSAETPSAPPAGNPVTVAKL